MSERYLPVDRTLISCEPGENTRSAPGTPPEPRLPISRSPACNAIREFPSLNCSSIDGQDGPARSSCLVEAGASIVILLSSSVACPRSLSDSLSLPSIAEIRALRRRATASSPRSWESSGSRETISPARPAALAKSLSALRRENGRLANPRERCASIAACQMRMFRVFAGSKPSSDSTACLYVAPCSSGGSMPPRTCHIGPRALDPLQEVLEQHAAFTRRTGKVLGQRKEESDHASQLVPKLRSASALMVPRVQKASGQRDETTNGQEFRQRSSVASQQLAYPVGLVGAAGLNNFAG